MSRENGRKIFRLYSWENFAGIEDAFGIKALLDAAHDFNPKAVLLSHELPFSDSNAVFQAVTFGSDLGADPFEHFFLSGFHFFSFRCCLDAVRPSTL